MRDKVEVQPLLRDRAMLDLLMLALLAAAFVAIAGFVHACAALTPRDPAGREEPP
jgi:hypothetical protein